MIHDLKALAHRWFEEVWNQGKVETIDELFASDAIAHGLGADGGDAIGPEGFKAFVVTLRSLLSNIKVDVEDTVVQGSKVAARVTLRAEYIGKKSAGDPRRVEISAISIVTVADDKIIEAWNNWDQFGMLQQIGAIPSGSDALAL